MKSWSAPRITPRASWAVKRGCRAPFFRHLFPFVWLEVVVDGTRQAMHAIQHKPDESVCGPEAEATLAMTLTLTDRFRKGRFEPVQAHKRPKGSEKCP